MKERVIRRTGRNVELNQPSLSTELTGQNLFDRRGRQYPLHVSSDFSTTYNIECCSLDLLPTGTDSKLRSQFQDFTSFSFFFSKFYIFRSVFFFMSKSDNVSQVFGSLIFNLNFVGCSFWNNAFIFYVIKYWLAFFINFSIL